MIKTQLIKIQLMKFLRNGITSIIEMNGDKHLVMRS